MHPTAIVRPQDIERVTPQELYQWLSTFNPEDHVCESMDARKCVFHNYFTARYGAQGFVIGVAQAKWNDGEATMPHWTLEYQVTLFGRCFHNASTAITAAEAIDALGPFVVAAQLEAAR